MSRLRVRWLSPPVQWPGLGVGDSWALAMERYGWTFASADEEWDVVFVASESQLTPELLDGDKPVVCYFWGWPPERFVIPKVEVNDKPWQEFVQERIALMFRCAKVLVPGPVTLDQAYMLGLTNAEMVVAGMDAAMLDAGEDPVGGPSDEILFLSRLTPHKGLTWLIDAMTLLARKPLLRIMGPGDAAPYKAYADERGVATVFETHATDEDKVRALRGCMMLCHPSSYEGFGVPPLEALYLGKPVVASGIPQLRWLLQDTVQYAESATELASRIAWVFSNYAAASQQAKLGQERVKRALTMDVASIDLTNALHQAVKLDLGRQIREDPSAETMHRVYEIEHRRNADTPGGNLTRFDPTWARHWRAEAFVSALTDGGAVVIGDVGCGAVYPTIFARAGFKVRALDISEEALRQVREIADKWGVPPASIETFQGRAEELPWEDGSLDGVVLGEILEHVTDPHLVLREAFRVCKDQGTVIISTPIGNHHWDPMHIGPDGGGWDARHMEKLIEPYADQVVRNEQIAEDDKDPSCWHVVFTKDEEIAAAPQT